MARDIAKTDAYVTSRRERKKVEMLFAHLKRIVGLDRLRLRGPCGVRDEFLLAATAQNLRKLGKLIPPPRSGLPGLSHGGRRHCWGGQRARPFQRHRSKAVIGLRPDVQLAARRADVPDGREGARTHRRQGWTAQELHCRPNVTTHIAANGMAHCGGALN